MSQIPEGKFKYVQTLVEKWTRLLETLSYVEKPEPHAAYAVFISVDTI